MNKIYFLKEQVKKMEQREERENEATLLPWYLSSCHRTS